MLIHITAVAVTMSLLAYFEMGMLDMCKWMIEKLVEKRRSRERVDGQDAQVEWQRKRQVLHEYNSVKLSLLLVLYCRRHLPGLIYV